MKINKLLIFCILLMFGVVELFGQKEDIVVQKGHSNFIIDVFWNKTSTEVKTVDVLGEIIVWDIKSGKQLASFKSTSFVKKKLYLTADKSYIWVGKHKKIHNNFQLGFSCYKESKENNIVVAGDMLGRLFIYKLSSGRQIKTIKKHKSRVNVISFSPDGKYFATAGFDRAILLWDSKTFELLKDFKPVSCRTNSLEYLQDENLLILGKENGVISYLSINNMGLNFSSIKLHKSAITDIQLSNVDNTVLSKDLYGENIWSKMITGEKSGQFLLPNKGDRILSSFIIAIATPFKPFWGTVESFTEITNPFPYAAPYSSVSVNKPEIAHFYDGKSFEYIEEFYKRKYNIISDTITGMQCFCIGNTISLIKDSNDTINLKGHSSIILDLKFNYKKKHLISASLDASIKIWSYEKNKLIATLYTIGDNDLIYLLPDKYYFGTRGSFKGIVYNVDDKPYSFEQFDLKYNRPDIVLSRLGYADSTLVQAYHKAYLKRLKKMGFKEEDLGDDFHMPESKIKNFEYLPTITNEKEIELDLNFNDSKYKLDRINVWINNVPVYGVKGISLKAQNTNTSNKKIKLQLSQGKNNIQVSCLNQKGAESYKETIEINYEPKEKVKKPELYIIAISVSNYLDERMNLQYAVKDGRDITKTYLSQKKLYSKIHIDTLFDENATKTNILKLKQKLMQSNIDDQVIVFVSGHGLLDENFDFYFATYDIDFDYPQYMGITYNSLESLLDSIPARKKLLLMDACHSGEVDKDDILEVKNTEVVLADGKKSGLKTYTYRSSSTEKNQTALNNSFELMQELFANLNRGSGAVVISAAAGSGFALESPEWNNGVFTYSVINGIKNQAADVDKNKEITVGELQKYVAKEVQKITGGEQKPTARQENLEFDFRVW